MLYKLFYIFGFICGGFGIVYVLLCILGIPLFWRFDRMFKGRPNIADFGIPLFGMMGRIFSYMASVVLKDTKTNKYFSVTFQGYDFYANTNLFEKIICYMCVWSGILMAVFAVLWITVRVVLYFQTGIWPQ